MNDLVALCYVYRVRPTTLLNALWEDAASKPYKRLRYNHLRTSRAKKLAHTLSLVDVASRVKRAQNEVSRYAGLIEMYSSTVGGIEEATRHVFSTEKMPVDLAYQFARRLGLDTEARHYLPAAVWWSRVDPVRASVLTGAEKDDSWQVPDLLQSTTSSCC